MNVASLPSFVGAVPAAPPARPPAPASASGGQAAAEFPGFIAALLAAMPAELEAAADPMASGSGGKWKTDPGIPAKTSKTPKKPPAVSIGPVVPSSSPTAAAPLPKPAQPASGDARKAPAKGAPSDTAEAASESGSPAVPPAASGHAKDPGTNLAPVPASAPAPATVAPMALPAVAPAASPAEPKGSSDKLRTEQISVPAAAVAQPQPAAPDASRSSGTDAARPPAAVPATAPDEDLPSQGKPPAAKTELAFAARLTEQSSESAASDGPSQAASAAKNDAAATPAPPSAAEAARSSRPASSKEPEKAAPENSSGALEPAGARGDTTVPAGSGPLLRSTAQPVTGAKDIAPAAPLDLEPARAQLGPQPVRQLSIVIPQTASDGVTQEPVEVRVLDSGGQLHVAVRSADPSLNQSLGNHLGDLVTQLEHSGYRTETWRPVVSAAVVGGVSAVSGTSAQQLRGGADQENSSGSGRGNQGGDAEDSSKRQRRDQDKTAPQWLDLLDESGSPQINSERISLHGNVSA